MNTKTWVGFVPTSVFADREVMLFISPIVSGTTAPYKCSLGVQFFLNGAVLCNTTIDGFRLGQPDGIDLKLLLRDVIEDDYCFSGYIGFVITLGCGQNNISLEESESKVFITSQGDIQDVIYQPIEYSDDLLLDKSNMVPVRDGNWHYIIINPLSDVIEASFLAGETESGVVNKDNLIDYKIKLDRYSISVVKLKDILQLNKKEKENTEETKSIKEHGQYLLEDKNRLVELRKGKRDQFDSVFIKRVVSSVDNLNIGFLINDGELGIEEVIVI